MLAILLGVLCGTWSTDSQRPGTALRFERMLHRATHQVGACQEERLAFAL